MPGIKYANDRERITRNAIVAPSGCWEWARHKSSEGYGRLSIGGRGAVFAHRVSYESFVGPIPDGLQIDHLCRNRACVNPKHLEPVTAAENVARALPFRSPHPRSTVDACDNGHPYTPENTAVRRSSWGSDKRACLTCERARTRAYRIRKQLAAANFSVGVA